MGKITGEVLRNVRLSLGMKQEELAKELCVSLRSFQNWEKGNLIPSSKDEFIRTKLNQLLNAESLEPLEDTQTISIPSDAWRVIQKLSNSLSEKDHQISELIAIIKENKYGSKTTEQDS